MAHQRAQAKGRHVRIRGFLGVLASVGATVLAVGCGTEHVPAGYSQPVGLAAAVSHTSGQTARIASTISTRAKGMTISFTERGLFDFARSRGTISMQHRHLLRPHLPLTCDQPVTPGYF